jgi:hypothetical protein
MTDVVEVLEAFEADRDYGNSKWPTTGTWGELTRRFMCVTTV